MAAALAAWVTTCAARLIYPASACRQSQTAHITKSNNMNQTAHISKTSSMDQTALNNMRAALDGTNNDLLIFSFNG